MTEYQRKTVGYRVQRNRRVVLVLGGVALVLAATWLHMQAGLGLWMAGYEAIRLFQIEGNFDPKLQGWQLAALWTLRFAAPAVTLGAVVELIDHVGLLHLPSILLRLFGKDHFVVVGLGRLGTHVCERLHADGRRVCAVERNAEHEDIGHLRAIGIPVIVGDATRPETLRQARITTAVALLALTEDDVTNVTVATYAEKLRGDHDNDPFESIVQVHDLLMAGALPSLCPKLGPHVRILDRYGVAADHLVERIKAPTDLTIIAGFGRFGQGVARSLSRSASPPAELWVVDPHHPHPPPEALHLRLPKNTTWKPASMLSDGILEELAERVQRGARAQFFICTDDDHRNLRYALAVRARAPTVRVIMRAFHLEEFSALEGLEVVDFINLLAPDDRQLFEHLRQKSIPLSAVPKQE